MIERTPIVILLIATAIITLILAAIVWRKRSTGRAAIFLSLCMAAVSIYSFGYAMELLSDTLETAMFWVRFQHWGIQVIAPTWLLFALSVSGFEKRVSTKLIIALSIIPLYLLINAETLGWLNLGHHNPRMDLSGAFPIFTYDRSLFNYIAIGYYSFCIAVSTVLFAIMLFRSVKSFREHAVIYLVGSLPPWFGLISYNLALPSSHIDYTPVILGVSGLFFAFGFVQFRMLDIIPLARDSVFDSMRSGVLILDDGGRVVDFNQALVGIFPHLNAKSTMEPGFELFSEYPSLMTLIQDNNLERIEIKVNNGETPAYYRVSKQDMLDRRKTPIGSIISFYEFTHEKHLLERLEKLAALDGLTGIYNRQHFNQLAINELDRIQRYGGVLSMIMLDLDSFKEINDTYGHAAGDLALVTLAETFSKMIRKSDILARFGGEEFVLLLPQTDVLAAKSLAERLCHALEGREMQFEGHTFTIQASFGVTGFASGQKMTLEALYRLADRALYRAKEQGGNRACVCLATDSEEVVFMD